MVKDTTTTGASSSSERIPTALASATQASISLPVENALTSNHSRESSSSSSDSDASSSASDNNGVSSVSSFVDDKKPLLGIVPQESKPTSSNKLQSHNSDYLRTSQRVLEDEEEIESNAHNAHALAWEQVMDLLETNAETGLTATEAAERLEKFGKNKLSEAPPETFLRKLFRHINSIFIYILLIAACLAGGFQEWPEFGLILAVVFLNVLIGIIQEGKAEKATAALKAMLSLKATVIRDGVRTQILSEDVVPGDLVFIESGDKAPADLRLVNVSNLAMLESMLTGESLAVNKHTNKVPLKMALGDRKNMAFSATSAIKGQATGIVVATGDQTQIGKINKSVAEVKQEKTILMQQVDIFGAWVGMMIIPVAIASWLLAYFSPGPNHKDVGYAFIEAIAIAVAIVPEGLPAMITITLSFGTSEMARHNAIVKMLPSVETLGAVSVICSDKTGTLTKNEMTVVSARTKAALYKVDKVGYDPTDGKIYPDNDGTGDASEDAALQEMIKGGALCNDSRIERIEIKGNHLVQPVGDPTEVALVTLAAKNNTLAEDLRRSIPRIGVIPFESEHKFMCTFHNHPSDPNRVTVYAKGAPDRLISRSAFQMKRDGTIESINVQFWLEQASTLGSLGLRCLAICTAEIERSELAEALAQGAAFVTEAYMPFLTYLGIAAIMDPPREECITSIQDAHRAGITVKMITGDHPGTAKAIGQQLKIVDNEHALVITGPELDEMSLDELREVVMKCNVFARASPENKIDIVRALRAEEKICSMTGDGVNDAPALRAAHIGVAMGITGTDVSKDAAKMILTDDNFTTILVAVKQGRRVWDNLKKLLIFNMPVNFGQGGIVFFALCLQWEIVPLSPLQILYVNLVISCTLGLMFAAEPPESSVMDRAPRNIKESLIGPYFFWRILFVAPIFIIFVLGSVAWLNKLEGPAGATAGAQHAIALNTLVFSQTAYSLTCRFLHESSLHPRVFRGNILVWVSVGLIVVLQLLFTYVPGLNKAFAMEGGMDGKSWGIVILFAVCTLLIIELEKYLSTPLKPYVEPYVERIVHFWDHYVCCCRTKLRQMTKKKSSISLSSRKLPNVGPQASIVSNVMRTGGSLRFVPRAQIKEYV